MQYYEMNIGVSLEGVGMNVSSLLLRLTVPQKWSFIKVLMTDGD